MKIALITLPVRFTRMPPIDLAYLLAYLEERGHEVYARDFNLELPVSDGGGARNRTQRNYG